MTTEQRVAPSDSVALIDWDGTIRSGFTIQEWISFLARKELLPASARESLQPGFRSYDHGEISHDQLAERTAQEYARMMKGTRAREILAAAGEFVREDGARLQETPSKVLQLLLERGFSVVVVSGAPLEVLEEYARRWGFAEVHGLELETRDGVYTGRVKSNPGTTTAKRELADTISRRMNTRIRVAMGNSPSDEPLFAAAPVAVVVGDMQPVSASTVVRPGSADAIRRITELIEKGGTR